MKGLLIVLGILLILAGAWYFWSEREDLTLEDETVFCTMDAMLCPDGSYVGRVPPSCEFDLCPGGMQSTSTSTSSPTSTPTSS